MSFFESFRQSLNDPHALHAMLVHFPIVMSLFGAALLIALALVGFRSRGLKLLIAMVFLIASAGALMAKSAGEEAEEHLEEHIPPLTQVEHDAVEEHEDVGSWVWVWALAPAALTGLSLTKRRRVRLVMGLAALATGLGAAGAAGYTAHLGGRLVYVHGLGTPDRTLDGGEAPGAHTHEDGEEHEH